MKVKYFGRPVAIDHFSNLCGTPVAYLRISRSNYRCETLEDIKEYEPIPVAARSKASACSHSLDGIVGSNPTGA
jgi:hypothetical protein